MTDCRLLLARNMKKYRETQGISQMELAEKIGCSTTFIGNIEINRRFPSAENINRIAKALNVKIADLFSETETETIKKMATKQEFKIKLGKVINKSVDELFR